MWLMKKSRKVISVNTNIKDEHVSLPKTQQLAQMMMMMRMFLLQVQLIDMQLDHQF